MPFLDQRYQLLNAPRLNNMLPVLVIPNQTSNVTITNQNVVYVEEGGNPNKLLLPPITPNNQGRGIYIAQRENVDPTVKLRIESSAPASDFFRSSGGDTTFVNVGQGTGRLFVARTVDLGAGLKNYWLQIILS